MGGGYTYKSGTSMASPHVAGVAALWAERQLDRNGFVNVATLESQLRAQARTDRLPGASYLDVSECIEHERIIRIRAMPYPDRGQPFGIHMGSSRGCEIMLTSQVAGSPARLLYSTGASGHVRAADSDHEETIFLLKPFMRWWSH